MTTIIARGVTQAVTVVTYATSQLLWQNLDDTTIYDYTRESTKKCQP